jgi:ABC-type branched-subunit amino acid transport system substrate-binding protein
MNGPATTAALTLSLTGPFARQGTEAAEGVRLWAQQADVQLTLVDDGGSAAAAAQAYPRWVDSVDLLLGPYSSGLVRATAPLVCEGGRVLWNHGGSADDLARPGVASLPAPASSYFDRVLDEAASRRVDQLVVVRGPGRFARAVADGATTGASKRGLPIRTVDATAVDLHDGERTAVLVVGRFDHDVAVVRQLRGRRHAPTLVAAVAAGIPAFGQELGHAAEGVLGPVQWWPTARAPEIGPSGAEFGNCFRQRTGAEPSYVAAQAAAAGYLAHAAHRLGLAAADLVQWATSTLLGDFALDAAWRQIGHRSTTVRWLDGRMVPIAPT